MVIGALSGPGAHAVESFLVATGLVALAEIGDKTQLLAFCLAAQYRRPVPIISGILAATVLNHAFAAGVGVWLTTLLPADTLRWLIGGSFIAMAVWVMVPDTMDDDAPTASGRGIFMTTLVVFFLAEMGDKTQVATVALAAGYASLFTIVAGTTLGMLAANVPAVYLGECCTRRVPLPWVRAIAALGFVVLGILVLFSADRLMVY